MREIKFRAWDEVNKRMVEVKEIRFRDSRSTPYELRDESGDVVGQWLIDKPDLMQYTGLKDKNGKEIYEFDYLAFGEKQWVIKVEYLDGMFGAYEPMSAHWQDLAYWVYGAEMDCTVIGNVFENPELLEK